MSVDLRVGGAKAAFVPLSLTLIFKATLAKYALAPFRNFGNLRHCVATPRVVSPLQSISIELDSLNIPQAY